MTMKISHVPELRRARGWTQEALALAADLSVRSIQRMETGGPVSAETELAVAGALDVDRSELWGETDEERAERALAEARERWSVHRIPRLTNGREVGQLLDGAGMYRLDHENLQSEDEREVVGSFIQDFHDWGELWRSVEPLHQVQAEGDFGGALKRMSALRWRAFGVKRRLVLRSPGESDNSGLPIWEATLVLRRADDQQILDGGTPNEALLGLFERRSNLEI